MQFKAFDLGLVDFEEFCRFQKGIFQQVKGGLLKSAVILCRHYPVITAGRLANKKNILAGEEELKKRGIGFYAAERGGDVTYHGPGQLMVYPVFNLNYFKKDIRLFLRNLEYTAIQLLSELGLVAQTKPGFTGVWLDNKKISSIGIAIRNWITYHGMSVNIKKDDLMNFSLIRPCGMDIMMTSAESALNKEVSIENITETLIRRWQNDQSSFTGIR